MSLLQLLLHGAINVSGNKAAFRTLTLLVSKDTSEAFLETF